MFSSIFSGGWWENLGPQVQQAIVGGLVSGFFTIVTASVGVAIVFFQLRKQAVNTIAANRLNEAMKLKKEIYQTILEVCRAADTARFEAANQMRSAPMFLSYFTGSAGPPDHDKAMKFLSETRELMMRSHSMNAELLRLITKWRIIEPRMEIFMPAIGVANRDILEAEHAYETVFTEIVSQAASLPEDEDVDLEPITKATEALDDALMERACVIGDFEREMQNALLGDLFERTLPANDYPGRKGPTIAFGKEEELFEYWKKNDKRTAGIV